MGKIYNCFLLKLLLIFLVVICSTFLFSFKVPFPDRTHKIGVIILFFMVAFVLLTINNFRRFPGISEHLYIIPIWIFWNIFILVFVRIFNCLISIYFYSVGSISLLCCCFVLYIIQEKFSRYLFAYIPVGRAKDMPEQIPEVAWVMLKEPNLETNVNAIVTDLHSDELGGDWQHFLAEKTLQGVPVYQYRQIREALTGRVRITHLYENDLGSLLPSGNYMLLKSLIGIVIVILTLPLTILVGIITAIAIKLDDGGAIFYSQSRIGFRGKIIKVLKFRSMKEKAEVVLTVDRDDRITRVGRFIRKTRIDELPQFINVIKGEMCLIGPRAEFLDFARDLEKDVPFFNYRHIVKPGISGWAQVNQGYATGIEETKIKIEYDFFYIKHFSFSLDLLIFFKTIHTMLTGFGAR